MISGLRSAPWLRAADKTEPLVFSNCTTCMQRTERIQRQSYGCALEPAPPANLPVIIWSPPGGKHGFQVNPALPLAEVCPGYTASLPEVIEVARAHRHWQQGGLRDFCGEQPSEAMMIGVEIWDSEVSSVQSYYMTPESEGGGRK